MKELIHFSASNTPSTELVSGLNARAVFFEGVASDSKYPKEMRQEAIHKGSMYYAQEMDFSNFQSGGIPASLIRIADSAGFQRNWLMDR
jgi:hypothetical protein